MTVHERMAKVTRALSYIPKGSSPGVSYQFRGIDAVMNHLHGPLAEHGLYLSPRVLDDWSVNPIPGTNNRTQYQATFRVCIDVYAEDGTMTTLGPGLAQSHDYGDKAVYQAQQNAIKYLLLEAFAIPTAEQDMDARAADESPRFDVGAFAAGAVEQFEQWDPDRRRMEWKEALVGGQPRTLEEAVAVVERMRAVYDAEHPPQIEGQEALTLDE